MNGRRGAVVALFALVVVVSTFPGAAPVAGAEPAITNVTVSPQEPQPGDLVRFTTTVRNSEGADGSFEITAVWIRQAGTTTEYARVSDPGNVPPGSSLDVPLTARFDSTGIKELRVRVNVVDENDELTTLQYPVTLVVSERGTQLAIDADEPVEGERTSLNVTVSNGGADPIRQLDLCIDGTSLRPENPCRLVSQLDANQDRTFGFDATFTAAGSSDVEATLEYTSSTGQTREVSESASVTVEELREDVAVEATVGSGGDSTPPILVEVTNFGNARVEDISVRVTDGEQTVARRAVAPIAAGSSRGVRVNVSDVQQADLDVAVAYETGGRVGSVETTLAYASQPARIRLTGIDFSADGGLVTISGSASNVGLTEANSVVVAVGRAPGVTPAGPNQEYFVGSVPASDFVSFDLTARVSANATGIPVEITYLADGTERTRTVQVDYEPPVTERGSAGPSGGLGLIPLLIGLGVVVTVGAVIYVGWRNRGGE